MPSKVATNWKFATCGVTRQPERGVDKMKNTLAVLCGGVARFRCENGRGDEVVGGGARAQIAWNTERFRGLLHVTSPPVRSRGVVFSSQASVGRARRFPRLVAMTIGFFCSGCTTILPATRQASVPQTPSVAISPSGQPVAATLERTPPVGQSSSRTITTTANLMTSKRPSTDTRKASRASIDNEKIKFLIAYSRAQYRGYCACPEDVDEAGDRCGELSHYSLSGDSSVLCYVTDVQPDMVKEYRILP